MASRDLILRVQTLARKNGRNPDDYTPQKIALREREARQEGKSPAEFADELLLEVCENPVNVVVNSVTHVRERQGYSQCPECGDMTLVHEGGCMSCRKCGYSRCG